VFSTQWHKNHVSTPIETRLTTQENESAPADAEATTLYQQIVGSILYAAISSRPDVAYAASMLGRHSKNHNSAHMNAACRALRYLECTKQLKLALGGKTLSITVYSDSDYAGDKASAK